VLEQCKENNKQYGSPVTLVVTNTMLDQRTKNTAWKRMFLEFLESYDI
jgi:hypothetical protein